MDATVIKEGNKIELIDVLDTNESKEEVIIPYLTGLYKDLLLRSDEPTKGIPRVILIDVIFNYELVFEYAWNHRRTCIYSIRQE